MKTPNPLRIVGLLLLGTAVFLFKGTQEKPLFFVLATFVVIAFWALNSLKISRFNLRAFIMILLLFGVPFVMLRQLPIFSSPESTAGPWTEESFDPALMGSIHLTHEIAMQVYFDHRPNADERYYKTETLEQTKDGIRYQDQSAVLNPLKMPKTIAWADRNLSHRTITAKVRTIESWFERDFRYSLAPGQLLSPNPLDQFLFDRRVGYCEHFSAALATLLKLSGTRARVAVGFEGGAWNPLTEELTYEMADSHAWVEAYDPEQKIWIRFDPTSWVASTETRERAGSPLIWFAATGALLLLLYGAYRARRVDPLALLIQNLSHFEKSQNLSGLGLTFAERLERLVQLMPMTAKRREQIEHTLNVYHLNYFGKEPTDESRQLLRKSISVWSSKSDAWFALLRF